MAWQCSGRTNIELVNNLKRNGIFTDERVEAAMLKIDRGDFAPFTPYGDHPVSIGYGATISAPHMHAHSLQTLKDHLKEGAKVLDVGSGSGYLTACMAEMVGNTGKVIGIDHIPELIELAVNNTRKNHDELIESGRLKYVVGDGREGYAPCAPYNAIHVGAAAPKLPEKLVEQLAKGGRMLVPIGASQLYQRYVQIDKCEGGSIKTTDLMGVVYVPLTDKENQVD
uniref:Protein-L-isoaspartate O-methyltransferase n=1 Tax=Syphacia muris TaxID=451379 RepID=A0A0N5A8P3_9BILA